MMDEENEIVEQVKSSIAETESLIAKLRQQEQQLVSQLSTALYHTQIPKQRQPQSLQKYQTLSTPLPLSEPSPHNPKLQKQLLLQLSTTSTKLKQIQYQLKLQQKKKPQTQLQSLNQLFSVQTQIKQTQTNIKSMNDQIKNLNNLKKKYEKVLVNKESTLSLESQKMSKLMDELYLLRGTMEKIKGLENKKRQDVEVKKQEVKSIQEKYLTMCEKNGDKPVIFEQFKAMMKNKVKSISQTDKNVKKQYVSIRQLIKSKEKYEHVQPTKQNLLELRSKKEIANHALRNAKKKHEVELRELKRRLESVKEENQVLRARMEEKEKEKREVGQKGKKGRGTPMV